VLSSVCFVRFDLGPTSSGVAIDFPPRTVPNHFANTLALTPFPRGSDKSMVRAYFGAKKMILVERPTTHRGTLSFGRGCDGPSS